MRNILFALALLTEACFGQSTRFFPTDDGSIYNNGNIVRTFVTAYASLADAGIEGHLHFASFDASQYTSIYLELNIASSPISSSDLHLYGYDNAFETLSTYDYHSGTYLGQLDVPPDIHFNEEILFDVTSFVQSAQGPFFGFGLQAHDFGAAYFTSTGNNNGIPPALIAVIPEPASISLLALSGLPLGAVVCQKKGRQRMRTAQS